VSGLGTAITNFTTIQVDAGASWLLKGQNTVASGTTLVDAGALEIGGNSTLTNAGSIAGAGGGLLADAVASLRTNRAISGPVMLRSAGYLYNAATGRIAAAGDGVLFLDSASLVNAGSIAGSTAGIYLQTSGVVVNAAGGAV